MQHRPAHRAPVQPAHRAPVQRTAGDAAVDGYGPWVPDDMTVEVALSVMAGARTRHLVVIDGDGTRTGLFTRAQLTAARDGALYTDRIQLRDILGGAVAA